MPEGSEAKHVLLVLSNPVAGREDECNDWYAGQHIPEALALPGFTAARRYRLDGAGLTGFEPSPHRYLAVYELDGPPQDALDALERASGNGDIVLSPSLDLDMCAWCFELVSEHRPQQS